MKKLTLTLASVLALAVFAMPALADEATQTVEPAAVVLDAETGPAAANQAAAALPDAAPIYGQSTADEILLPTQPEALPMFGGSCPAPTCDSNANCFGQSYHCGYGEVKTCLGGTGYGGGCQGTCVCC